MNYYKIESRFQGNDNYWIAPYTCLIKSEKDLSKPNQYYVKYYSYNVSGNCWEINHVTYFYGVESVIPLEEEQVNKLVLALKLRR